MRDRSTLVQLAWCQETSQCSPLSVLPGRRVWLRALGTLAFLLLLPGAARAQFTRGELRAVGGEVRFGEVVAVTAISGSAISTATTTTVVRLESDDPTLYGLYGGLFSERGDQPCDIKALFENVRDREDDRVERWRGCGRSGPTAGSNAAAGFGDGGVLDKRAFVTGLQACVNGNDKLKGVRFFGQRIRQRGRLSAIDPPPPIRLASTGGPSGSFTDNTQEPVYDFYRRPGCSSNSQRAVVTCPAGSAATALLVHHVRGGSRRKAAGLSLECRTVLRTVNNPLQAAPPRTRLELGASSFTGISGFSGRVTRILRVGNGAEDFSRSALTGTFIRENLDRPCQLTLFGRDIGGQTGGRGNVILRLCNRATGTANATSSVINLDAPRFVRAIEVCTTNKKNTANDRLKGLRIIAASIDPTTGQVTSESTEESYEYARCNRWHSRVSCPSGEVAVGMRVHANGKAIRGLELECAPVMQVEVN